MLRVARCGVVLLALMTWPGMASPEPDLSDGRTGRIRFESSTPTDELSVVTGRLGPRTVVEGALHVPAGEARIPAVVIAHGSGGVRPDREPEWAKVLGKAGIAAFVVDSYGPRKVSGTETGDIDVSTMANVADAFAALRLLSTHPRVDPARVAIMGYSRGGQVALWTSFEVLRRTFMESSPLAFAAHVSIYPACNMQRVTARVSPSPILHLHGEADDLTPLAVCREYLDRLRAAGASVRTIVYPGAYHDFDFATPARYAPQVRSAARCHAEIDLDQRRYRRLPDGPALASRKEYADYERSCTSRGAMIGGNPKARTQAYADAVQFLAAALRR